MMLLNIDVLEVCTILAEHIKDQFLALFDHGYVKESYPKQNHPKQQSEGLLRHFQEFGRLLIEEEGQLLSYYEPSDKLEDNNLQICLP